MRTYHLWGWFVLNKYTAVFGVVFLFVFTKGKHKSYCASRGLLANISSKRTFRSIFCIYDPHKYICRMSFPHARRSRAFTTRVSRPPLLHPFCDLVPRVSFPELPEESATIQNGLKEKPPPLSSGGKKSEIKVSPEPSSLCEGTREESVSCLSPSFWVLLPVLSLQPHKWIPASIVTWRPLCACVPTVLMRTLGILDRAHPHREWHYLSLLTSAKALFLNKVTFTGTRGVETSTYLFKGTQFKPYHP